jgi:hypothetical protein
MRIRVEIDGDLSTAIRRAGDRAQPIVTDALTEIGQIGESIAKNLAPVRTGRWQDSIGYNVERFAVEIGSPSKRTHLVEKGRGPGKMPPPTLLADVMQIPIGEAFLIARMIGAWGTLAPEVPVFKLTRRAMKNDVQNIAREALEEIAAVGAGRRV